MPRLRELFSSYRGRTHRDGILNPFQNLALLAACLISVFALPGFAQDGQTDERVLSEAQSRYVKTQHSGLLSKLSLVRELVKSEKIWEAGKQLLSFINELEPCYSAEVTKTDEFKALDSEFAQITLDLARLVETRRPEFREAVNQAGRLLAKHDYESAKKSWESFFNKASATMATAQMENLTLVPQMDGRGNQVSTIKTTDRRGVLEQFGAMKFYFWDTNQKVIEGWNRFNTLRKVTDVSPWKKIRTKGLEYTIHQVSGESDLPRLVYDTLYQDNLLHMGLEARYAYVEFTVRNTSKKEQWARVSQVKAMNQYGRVFYEPSNVARSLSRANVREPDAFLILKKGQKRKFFRVIEIPIEATHEGFVLHFPDANPSDKYLSSGPYYVVEGHHTEDYIWGDDLSTNHEEDSPVSPEITSAIEDMDVKKCAETGHELWSAQDFDAAIPYLEKACPDSAKSSCFLLGHIWYLKFFWAQSADASTARLKELQEKATYNLGIACSAGNPHACVMFGAYHRKGFKTHVPAGDIKKQYVKQVASTDKYFAVCTSALDCADGDFAACTRAGITLDDLWITDEHVGQSHRELKKPFAENACEGGNMQGCLEAGHIWYRGGYGVYDKAVGREYYIKACQGGLREACAVAR